jgi:hypothetical protein
MGSESRTSGDPAFPTGGAEGARAAEDGADASIGGDGPVTPRRVQHERHRVHFGRRRLIALTAAGVLVAAAVAALEIKNHLDHTAYNNGVVASGKLPTWLKPDTPAWEILEHEKPAEDTAAVGNPTAVSGVDVSSLKTVNLIYDQKQEQVPEVVSLLLGGGDPSYNPGVIAPMPLARFKLDLAELEARGVTGLSENPSNTLVDAEVVDLDINNAWTKWVESHSPKDVSDFVASYVTQLCVANGLDQKGAGQYGAVAQALYEQWPDTSGTEFSALIAQSPAYQQHIAEVADAHEEVTGWR